MTQETLYGVDFYIDRNISKREFAKAIALFFGIEVANVFVTEELDVTPFQMQVFCQLDPVQGDFKKHAVIYQQDKQLPDPLVLDAMTKLARVLRCKCLVTVSIDQDNLDPFVMVLVDENGSFREVSIDPEEERNDWIVIWKEE